MENKTIQSNESTLTESEQQNTSTTHFSEADSTVITSYSRVPQTIGLLPIKDQGISDFLGKPQYLSNFAWSVADINNTALFSYDIGDAVNIDIYKQKIKGFRYVRGTAVFRLVLNAEPFHAGKLIVSFIPCYKHLTAAAWRLSTLASKSMCPNVEIDCRETECIIKIPYITPTDYFDVVDGSFDWGTITVSVLSRLGTGTGSSTVYCSTFIHFEDFELAAPMVPQSGAPISKAKDRPSKSKSVLSAESQDLATKGTVSKALASAAEVAEDFTAIPSLAPLALPASWMLRGASGLASWFGWSKPISDTPPCTVTRRFVPNMANATGSATTPMLALFHDNAINIDSAMGAIGYDEMSFNYIKKVKSYVGSFIMSDTMLVNTSLYQKFMGPKFLGQSSSYTGTAVVTTFNVYTPGAYVARYFKYWRGGMVLHLKFVKTDYHSGRIMVTFTPGNGATPPTNASDSTYSLREIIDIREKSDVVLEIPFLLNRPYAEADSYCGYLDIKVLNELKAPSTVGSAIEVLVYFSMCDDFEVAVPGSVSTNNFGVNRASVPYIAQSGVIVTNDTIGGYVCPPPNMLHSQSCMGEMFTSIKQLLNRYTAVITNTTVTLAGSITQFSPTTLGATRPLGGAGGTGLYSQDQYYGDAMSAFACGYAFMKGSVKIMINQTLASSTTRTPVSFTYEALDSESPNYPNVPLLYSNLTSFNDPLLVNIGSFTPVQLGDLNGFHESQVPYYNEYKHILVDYNQNVAMLPDRNIARTRPRTMFVGGFLGATGTVDIRRAAGEDFQLAYFLGFPPIAATSTPL